MSYQAQIDVSGEEGWRNGGGDYARLQESDHQETLVGEAVGCDQDDDRDRTLCPTRRRLWGLCWWGVVGLLGCLCLVGIVVFCVIWIVSFLLAKVVVPALDWEKTTFSKRVLSLLLFASIAVFPVFCIPSTPSMWTAGITFGYGYGFLIIIAAASLGMSLPFMIGSFFHHRIHLWLEKWPEKAEIVRLAGEGNCFHQFHAIVLLRIPPFPYIILNYAAVATNTKYYPYIFGSLIGEIPDAFLTMSSGILIWKLADASVGHGFFSMDQIIYDAIGFLVALAATIAVTIYARRSLNHSLQDENHH